jgi:hypothetical protein
METRLSAYTDTTTDTLGTQLAGKADQTDLDALETEVATKADQSAMNSFDARITTNTNNIAVVKNAPVNIDYPEFAGYSTADAKVNAAIAALGSQGGRIFIPPGSRSATGPVTITRGDVEIFGSGPNRTLWAIQGNYNAFYWQGAAAVRGSLHDLWIGSFAARTAGFGLRVSGSSAASHIDNFAADRITFQNLFQPMFTEYLDRCQVSRLLFVQSISGAVGASLWRMLACVDTRASDLIAYTTAGTFPTEGILLDSDCDTNMLSGLEILDCGYGIRLRNSVGGSSTGPRLIRIRDCCIESSAASGILIEDGRDVQIVGGHAAVNTGSGVRVLGGTLLKIIGFSSLQNQLHGYHLNGGLGHTALVGCDASNNSQQTHATYDGIRIEDNQQHVSVQGGAFGDYVYTLTNKQRYGISIGSVNTDYIRVSNADLSRNQTGGLANFSTGTHNAIGTGANVT